MRGTSSMVRTSESEIKPMLEFSPRMAVWRVFATYVAAVAGIFAASGVAILALKAMFPDVADQALLQSLPGLIAGSLASSTALLLTLLMIVQPSSPSALRLRPGWETGRALAVMVLGMLALGQFLDSLVWLVGWGERGSLVFVRRVLESAVGPDLFGAVLVFGLIAGVSEEIFFRGFMLARLREHWGGPRAIVATAACFGVLHVDPNGIHMALAFVMGLYLGFVVERTGSTLPAIVCHVVNNVVYTLQTALGGTLVDRASNAVVAAACVLLLLACLAWLRRAAPPATTE
jgi:membrane protease YdiL (CAAX protease family)